MTSTELPRETKPPDGLQPNGHVLPLIAVAGSRGKTTVSSMLAAMMRESGKSIGSWLSSGVYVDDERLDGELHAWERVLLAARFGELDAVIQELEAPVTVAVGLPPRVYPLAVVTTICGSSESCRVAPETALERKALDRLFGAVRADGTVVANADDLIIVDALDLTELRHALFALHPGNPVLHQHLEDGGVGAWVEDGWIRVGTKRESIRVVAANQIPATLDGALTFQVQNALAAVCAAYVSGLDMEDCARALEDYSPDISRQPGACNIFEVEGARVVVDSPTSPWSLRMTARGIRSLSTRRPMVVSGSFPRVNDIDLREVGRVLGSIAGVVILHDESDDHERMEILKEGLASSEVPPIVFVMPTEADAIERLRSSLVENDVALVLTTDSEPVASLLGV